MELVPAGPIDLKPDRWQRLVAVGSILSVFFVAVGLYVTNEANREQQRLTGQGQITDRFTRAIEQLGQPGAEKVDVRLGAIYALERIMRDSAADQPAVVGILAAFVRVHSPAPQRVTPTPAITRPTTDASRRPRLPVDIQAALTVLGRRDITRDDADPNELRLDLANTDLTGANLTGANLAGADLAGADLTRAYLRDVTLTGAYLRGAPLTQSTLLDANLTRAFLFGADLTGAYLYGADLTGANLAGADLTGANLYGANLTGAYLRDATLTDAILYGVDLTGAEDVTSDVVRCARVDVRTMLPDGVTRPTPC